MMLPPESLYAHESTLAVAGETRLPLSHWEARGETQRVVLALHGFNDFRHFIASAADTLSRDGAAVYAYDQRGFGETPTRGEWHGTEQLVTDARAALAWVRERHPGRPVYLLGESMGAAIAMLALSGSNTPDIEGTILLAPAVWGRGIQPWYQRLGLWLGEQVLESGRVSTQWIDIEPSDDPETLRYWKEHPHVIREPSIKALAGLGDLMDAARQQAGRQTVPVLMLYGGRDQLVPPKAICRMLEGWPESPLSEWRFVYYPEGWHFLSRDSRSAETVEDIRAWLRDQDAALPSERALPFGKMKATVCSE